MAHRAHPVRAAASAATGFFFLSFFATAGGLLQAGCQRETASPAPASPINGEPRAQLKLRFDPPRQEFRDVAVGETVTSRIALVAETPVDWRDVLLVSSCDCLVAEYADTSSPTRAEVEVSVIGITTESIDGDVYAETADRVELASFRAPIDITRKPFVQPREVVLAKDAGERFELFVGQAFPLKAELPTDLVSELDPSTFDETKITLTGFDDVARELTENDVILRQRIECAILDEARASPFTTEIPIEFGQPPQQRRIVVRWPGR